jgi:hypothetical protein
MIELLSDLHARYPHNPIFCWAPRRRKVYRSDAPQPSRSAELVDGARGGSCKPLLAEMWGPGAAAQLTALAEPDRAADGRDA